MKYIVEHFERYVPDSTKTEYASIEAVLARYPITEYTFMDENDIPIKSGEMANVVYDHYITLDITAV